MGNVNSWRQNTKNQSVDEAVKGSAFHFLHFERMISTEKQSMEMFVACFRMICIMADKQYANKWCKIHECVHKPVRGTSDLTLKSKRNQRRRGKTGKEELCCEIAVGCWIQLTK